MAKRKTKEESKAIGAQAAEITECYYAKRFPDKLLGDKLVEWLNAQKTVSAVSGKGADAGTVDFVDVPDYQTQTTAGKMIMTLRGLDKKKVDVKQSGSLTVKVVNFSDGNNPAV